MTAKTKSFQKSARINARRTAVQALYQLQMNQVSMSELISEFEQDGNKLRKVDIEYFRDLLEGTAGQGAYLDSELANYLDREVTSLDPVERAILHIGMYELLSHPELPWRVVINESVELAKRFGAEESHKYINGVLDKAAQHIRASEINDSA